MTRVLCGQAFVAILSAKQTQWPLVLCLFGLYSGLSAGSNEDLIQALTSAPIAACTSLLVVRWGRQAGSDLRAYSLEQLLPQPPELIGFATMLTAVYVFTGLCLTQQCLPRFVGGPAAILLCYLLLFMLLLLHLSRAPDRNDDTRPLAAEPSASTIQAPLLVESASGAVGSADGWWRCGKHERLVLLCSLLSAVTTVVCVLVPVVPAVGFLIVQTIPSWTAIVALLSFFLAEGVVGAARLAAEPSRGNGLTGVLVRLLALFAVLLIPALATAAAVWTGAVSAEGQTKGFVLAPVAVSVVLGVCCVCGCAVARCRRCCD